MRDNIQALRPVLDLPSAESLEEQFQNEVLRPICKFQHDLIMFRFENDPFVLKSKVLEKNISILTDYVEKRFKEDRKLQREYIGFIIGLMSEEELKVHWEHKSELNRRILSLIVQRIIHTFKQRG